EARRMPTKTERRPGRCIADTWPASIEFELDSPTVSVREFPSQPRADAIRVTTRIASAPEVSKSSSLDSNPENLKKSVDFEDSEGNTAGSKNDKECFPTMQSWIDLSSEMPDGYDHGNQEDSSHNAADLDHENRVREEQV